MKLLRIALAVFLFAAAVAAQPPPFDVPLTYFVGASGGNAHSFASKGIVISGPGGDIWVAGVAECPRLPVVDTNGSTPPAASCSAADDRIASLFAIRLAVDGSGARFVQYVGFPYRGIKTLDGGSVDQDGNLYLVGRRDNAGRPFTEGQGYLIKVGPDGETLEDRLVMFVRDAGVGVDADGVIHHATYASINFDGLGPGPDATWTIVTGTPKGQREPGYSVHLNRKTGGTVRAEDIAVSADGWVYVCGVVRYPDFEITWPLAIDPQDKDGDIFVAAISPQGELGWTMSYGGSGAESSPKIVLSATGEVVVAGKTRSSDLPLKNSNAAALTGNDDFFILGIDAVTGQRIYSGYLGIDAATELRDLAAAPDGSTYLAGLAQLEANGQKSSTDLLLKINRDGELVRQVRAAASAIAVADDGRVITVGSTKSGLLDAGGFLYGPQSVYAAFLDLDALNDERPRLAAVLNASDSVPAVVSPGALVSLYGERLGPVNGVAASIEGGRFPTQAGGVRVLVSGAPAPLLYVSATQINAILPFDLGGPLAQVVVERDGVRSNVFSMTVTEAGPGPFQQAPPNSMLGAILNQDGTLNSLANPARAGSVVSLWATGLGSLSPPLADGEIVKTTGPFPGLKAEVSVEVDGIPAEIRYAGAAPGQVAGIAQINFVVPAGISLDRAPVQIRAGARQSYPTTRIALRP